MGTDYELQINGKPKFFYTIIGQSEINQFLEESASNPDDKVEIVRITTDVILGGYEYGQMQRHFKNIGEHNPLANLL